MTGNRRSRPLRIAILIPGTGPVVRGGESSAIGLARHLSSAHQVRLFGSRPAAGVDQVGIPSAVMGRRGREIHARLPALLRRLIERLHLDPHEFSKLVFCVRAFKALRRWKPDLLLVRSVGYWGSVLGYLYRMLFRRPFITITGGWFMSEYEHARWCPDAHICVNTDVRDYLRVKLPHVNVVFLPNAIDFAEFSREVKPAALDLQRPLVLAAGAVLECKRYDRAINAMARLPEGSLLILGRGRHALVEMIRKQGTALLGPDRFLLTSVPYEEMPSYVEACDALTLPSDERESFGMVLLEAMSRNKPVIASDDDMRRLIVGKGGVLCDPLDEEGYAAAISRALNEDHGDRPRRQAQAFDWSRIGPQYAQLFASIASRGRRRQACTF